MMPCYGQEHGNVIGSKGSVILGHVVGKLGWLWRGGQQGSAV